MRDAPGVAVTRAREDSALLVRELEARALPAKVTPLVRFDLHDPAPLARCLTATPAYDWTVCTSRHAVHQLEAACMLQRVAPADACMGKVGAVGDETARALEALGLTVNLRPAIADASHLAHAMLAWHGAIDRSSASSAPRVLFPRAAAARDELPTILREAHWIVDEVVCYETLPCADGATQLAALLAGGALGAVTLASGSACRAMASLIPAPLWTAARLVSIGPTTTAAARAAGLTIAAESPRPAMDALADTTRRVILDTFAHA